MENNYLQTKLIGANYKQFDNCSSPTKHPKITLKFTQWNLLAKWAGTTKSFPKVNPDLLTLEYRLPKIIALIKAMESDVYCFEECDFFEQLKSEFSQQFELSFYSKKNNADGGVIMWKKSLAEE
jgi:hypothetical protein